MKYIKFEPQLAQAVIDTAIDGVILIDARGCIRLVNPPVLELFGYSEEELIGEKINKLMPEPDKSRHDQYLNNYMQTGERKIIGIGREVMAKRKSGEVFPILLAVSEVKLANERYFAGILHDLTELSRVKERLEASEARMLHLSQNLPVGAVYRIGDELILNDRIQQITGYTNEDIKSLKSWFRALMGSGWEDYYEMYLQDKRRNFRLVRTYKITTKGGEARWVDFAAFADERGEVWILHDVTRKVQVESELLSINEELENRVREKTEKLRQTVSALQSMNNKLTERELELQRALSREKDLNELKTRFVSTASHEFRTPLSSILSSADLIEMYEREDQKEKREKHINRIKSSVKMLTNILNDFLSLSKIEEGKFQANSGEFGISDVFETVEEELRYFPKSGQKVIFREEDGPIVLVSDKKIVANILINLVNNALKYSDEDVECRASRDGDFVVIKVSDNGIGIPEEEQRHLFTRFFRAKNAENIQGTGLGLSIVKKYLEMLNGNISFKSKPGEGTEFTVSIPLNSQ